VKKSKISSAEQQDLARERDKAMQETRDVSPKIESCRVCGKAVSVHPTPTHEPTMPEEVYYHKQEMEAMGDPTSETEGRA